MFFWLLLSFGLVIYLFLANFLLSCSHKRLSIFCFFSLCTNANAYKTFNLSPAGKDALQTALRTYLTVVHLSCPTVAPSTCHMYKIYICLPYMFVTYRFGPMCQSLALTRRFTATSVPHSQHMTKSCFVDTHATACI